MHGSLEGVYPLWITVGDTSPFLQTHALTINNKPPSEHLNIYNGLLLLLRLSSYYPRVWTDS